MCKRCEGVCVRGVCVHVYLLTAAQVASLQESKKAKEQEIDKYKKYLNKAKKIIENIGESKTQPEDSLEVS